MDKVSTIKTQYEQTHYRKQRELIDAGKLDYWGLSERNKKGILQQCRDEGKKYRNLKWMATESLSDNEPAIGTSSDMMFHFTEYYYRRLDPLPTEEEHEVVELKKIKEANQALIAMLDKDLKAKEDEVRKLQDDLNQLEKDLSQQKHLAKAATDASTDRLNQITELNSELQKLYDTLENKEALLENYRKEEASLYRDIRTLAMKLA
jgi:chromosome segregation ATPase